MNTFPDYVILLLGNIANIYMIDNFFGNSFDAIRYLQKFRRRILVSTLFVILMMGLNSLHNVYLNLLGTLLLILLYVFIVFAGSIGSRLVYYVITVCIIFGGEIILALIVGTPYLPADNPYYMEMSSIGVQYFAIKLGTYILFTIAKQMSGKSREHMPTKLFGMYLCLPLSSLGILIIIFHSGVNIFDNTTIRVLLMVCSVFMFVGNILIFYAFHQHSKEAYRKSQLELMIEKREFEWKHLTQMVEQQEEQKRIIHDIANLIRVLDATVDIKKNKEVTNIIHDLNIDIERNEKRIYCQNAILNILLSEKVAEAEKKEIEMEVFVEPNIGSMKMREIDLVTSLGNLLDNAIQATSNCEEKSKIQVTIFVEKRALVFKIVNGFNGVLRQEDGRFLTTKEDKRKHGLGLKSVESIAARYNGSLACKALGNEFQAVLFIPID